jgi:hypothetical protein
VNYQKTTYFLASGCPASGWIPSGLKAYFSRGVQSSINYEKNKKKEYFATIF